MSEHGQSGAPPQEPGPHGADYWRELMEQVARGEPGARPQEGGTPGFPVSRRSFLQVLGASAALAGLSGCFEAPDVPILPYVDRPPEVTPGVGTFYATTLERDGLGTGVIVESREGRPVKVEGNPRHPASLGAAGIAEQAALLDLYDPSRTRRVRHLAETTSWSAFLQAFGPGAPTSAADGAGLHLLLEPTASPLVRHLLERLQDARPRTRVHFHAPLHAREVLDGTEPLLGRPLQPLIDPGRAEVMVVLDADPFASGPFQLAYARQFARRRRIRERDGSMSRLYVAEPFPTPTGDVADHRMAVPAGRIPAFAAALLREVAARAGEPGGWPGPRLEPWAGDAAELHPLGAIAADLVRHRGASLVVAGPQQPAEVHTLVAALNALLGNVGHGVRYVEPVRRDARGSDETLEALVDAMRAGEVDTLVVLGGNPVYDAPADLAFAEALPRVSRSVCLAPHATETARACTWHVPGLHPFESWGDARALDGTASIVQPLIAPLWAGASVADVLAALLDDSGLSTYERLRRGWGLGEDGWRRALAEGVVEGTAAAPIAPAPRWDGLARALGTPPPSPPPEAIELVFRADPALHDGRGANNPWLQELFEPITKLSWDNAAWLAPSTADALGVEDGDWLRLRAGERSIQIPALRVPGTAERSIALALGYGRSGELPVAAGVGFDVYPLRTSQARWRIPDARAEAVLPDARHVFARGQKEFRMQQREPVRELRLAELRDLEPGSLDAHVEASLYHAWEEPPPQWGMNVDLTICTGCSGCVVACQAENNNPVVGKEGVLHGRDMYWLRIDRYLEGPEDRGLVQPMLCQHCEMAPCEYVCPVGATVHSEDGLNEMIYNRCVGTRFCSNNCPYKVRRFNWFDWNAHVGEVRRLQFNPDVTVRARGVMEKCTYCVQRIRRAGIRARNEGREIRDGEVRTACQQACPTEAITFGSIADPDSEVSQVRRAPQAYGVLAELGTQPRTLYLARIRNPNPDLEGEG